MFRLKVSTEHFFTSAEKFRQKSEIRFACLLRFMFVIMTLLLLTK